MKAGKLWLRAGRAKAVFVGVVVALGMGSSPVADADAADPDKSPVSTPGLSPGPELMKAVRDAGDAIAASERARQEQRKSAAAQADRKASRSRYVGLEPAAAAELASTTFPALMKQPSVEIWDTASQADEYLGDGWLARAFAARPAPSEFAADGIVVGSSEFGPLAGTGTRTIALNDTDQFLRQARLAGAAARGGNAALTEADIRATVELMVAQSK